MNAHVPTTCLRKKNMPVPRKSRVPLLNAVLPLRTHPPRGHQYLEFCVRCLHAHLYSFSLYQLGSCQESRATVSDVG